MDDSIKAIDEKAVYNLINSMFPQRKKEENGMTGLERLREEMEKMGFNKAQIESKTAAGVLSILSEVDCMDEFRVRADIEKLNRDLSNAKLNANAEECRLAALRRKYHEEIIEFNGIENKIREMEEKAREQVKKINEEIYNCETAGARDRLRLAKFYKETVKPTNGYERNSFIIGMGAILSGQRNGIEEEKGVDDGNSDE